MIMVQERIVSPVSGLRHASQSPANAITGAPSAAVCESASLIDPF